jgi:predicted glycosyltransferase
MTRFWIDIANSPHATLLAPLVRELQARGHDFVVTAWDRAQTQELALANWPDAQIIGAGNDSGILAKGLRIARRARNLARAVRPRGARVALGHGSHAQILAARMLRVPAITMMDYEHQPATLLHYALAGVVLVPEAFTLEGSRRRLVGRRLRRYPGLKEEIALAGFEPDPGFRAALGVAEDEVLAVCRPAPEGALYHRGENPLFDTALAHVLAGGATVLLSPRDPAQAERYARDPRVRVLEHAVDGAQLLYHADLVVGAGGTMTREAAVMGTPSYSVFRERLGSVDLALIRAGRLVHVVDPGQVERIAVRPHPGRTWRPDPHRAAEVSDLIEAAASDLRAGR